MSTPGLNADYGRLRWRMFALTWLAYVGFYLARKSFAVAKVAFATNPESGVDLSRAELAIVDSSYLIAYACGQFVWGPLGDRLGPRFILTIGFSLLIAASLASGFATTLLVFSLFMIVQGVGQATGWSNLVKAMSSWFKVGERGRVMGWWCTSYTVGAAIAPPLAAWSMELMGEPGKPYWPAAFWVPAVIVAVIFVLVRLGLVDRPEKLGLPSIEEKRPEESTHAVARESGAHAWGAVGKVARLPAVWLLAACYFSIKLTRYAFYFWGPLYVNEKLGSGVFDSAITVAWLPLGGVLGVLVSGYLSDLVFHAKRIPVAAISLLLAVVVLALGQVVPIPTETAMGVYFFLIGFFIFGPDSIVSATSAMDFGTSEGSGTAAGIINGVGSIGAVLGVVLAGTITTEDNWTPLFYTFIGGLLVSTVVLIPLWNSRPSSESSPLAS